MKKIKKNDSFNLLEALKELGFKFEYEYKENSFCGFNKNFRIRGLSDRFQIGIVSTFDRWANSVDFECKYPQSFKKLNEIFEEVCSLVKCDKCSEWLNQDQQKKLGAKTLCDWHYKDYFKRKKQR